MERKTRKDSGEWELPRRDTGGFRKGKEVLENVFILNPFVTSPGDLRDLVRPFWYEPRRSPGLIAWDNYDVIK